MVLAQLIRSVIDPEGKLDAKPAESPSSTSTPSPSPSSSSSASPSQTAKPQAQQPLRSYREDTYTPGQRHFRQLSLLVLGSAFLSTSIFISRRSVVRLQKSSFPHFFLSNRTPASRLPSDDKYPIAGRALGLATLNVTSFGVLLVGGISWAFDLCSVTELRNRTQMRLQKGRQVARAGMAEEEKMVEDKVEEEMEKLLGQWYDKFGIQRPGAEDGKTADEEKKDA
ncbi:uncharacterized protein J7T54_002753 [Emericellopsis cladophorae]|uniref:Altered inheritance of mitochondria protein 11 n=1 Tax=Emericellopsis cladophorae TaxID=2686198 RepID=A0A9P9XUP5_9HYPO|nr:uncharacterized protein J7T54_002753 [Emericellopsis cladophorae]KAI6777855.1 hypothetical protein J7T54_002753 [Emericellopsis cladophorae]